MPENTEQYRQERLFRLKELWQAMKEQHLQEMPDLVEVETIRRELMEIGDEFDQPEIAAFIENICRREGVVARHTRAVEKHVQEAVGEIDKRLDPKKLAQNLAATFSSLEALEVKARKQIQDALGGKVTKEEFRALQAELDALKLQRTVMGGIGGNSDIGQIIQLIELVLQRPGAKSGVGSATAQPNVDAENKLDRLSQRASAFVKTIDPANVAIDQLQAMQTSYDAASKHLNRMIRQARKAKEGNTNFKLSDEIREVIRDLRQTVENAKKAKKNIEQLAADQRLKTTLEQHSQANVTATQQNAQQLTTLSNQLAAQTTQLTTLANKLHALEHSVNHPVVHNGGETHNGDAQHGGHGGGHGKHEVHFGTTQFKAVKAADADNYVNQRYGEGSMTKKWMAKASPNLFKNAAHGAADAHAAAPAAHDPAHDKANPAKPGEAHAADKGASKDKAKEGGKDKGKDTNPDHGHGGAKAKEKAH